MRIYVSPWGDPSRWSKVNYLKDDGKSVESFTSISTYENYDKILLLVQDSILVPQGYVTKEKKYRNSEIEECIESSKQTVLNPSSYEDWLKSIDNYVLCSIQKANVDPNKVKVIKVPGIGKFKGTFKGDVQVIYNFGVLKLGERETSLPLSYLESLLAYNIYEELKGVDEVILDITHGINYFSSLALMVMINLSSILNFKLEVINFIPTEMETTYTYKKILSLSNSRFDVNRLEKIKDESRKALILSLKMGAILPILYICKNTEGHVDYNKMFKENVSVEKGTSPNTFSVVVKPINELRESDRVWAYIISSHVCEKANEIKEQEGYSLKDIQKLAEKLSNFLSDTTEAVINSEINDIYSTAQRSLKIGEEEMYYRIYSGVRESPEEMLKRVDVTKRNFIAHAGFLKEIMKVKVKSTEEVLVRYYFEDEKYYEVLQKIYGLDVRKFLY